MRVTPLPIVREACEAESLSAGSEIAASVISIETQADTQIRGLTNLYRAYEDRALSGDEEAANVCLRITDRLMRMLGLDKSPVRASAEVNVTWAEIAAIAEKGASDQVNDGARRPNGRKSE
jgi:hypothetical protein